jgi:hypothetical protein
MTRSQLWILALGIGILTGCTYPGALYSEYTHLGLGIRSSIESAAPVDVELGYGRGAFSTAPKRSGQSAPGEAVSVIGVSDLHTIATPASLSDQSLLRVHAGFISGSAALAAVTPDDWTLAIDLPGVRSMQVKVQGGPQERLKAAFQPTARFLIPEHEILQYLIDRTNAREDAEAVYGRAGLAVSEAFTQHFEQKLKQGISKRFAFIAAKNQYVEDQPHDSPRWRQVISALDAALR